MDTTRATTENTPHLIAPEVTPVALPRRADGGRPEGSGDPVLIISCDTCVARDTDACSDCMMSVMCGVPADGAVILDIDELREVRMLAAAGLVPTLRHRAVG
jgi:hypothetical protein